MKYLPLVKAQNGPKIKNAQNLLKFDTWHFECSNLRLDVKNYFY